jgi:hypothetical protein
MRRSALALISLLTLLAGAAGPSAARNQTAALNQTAAQVVGVPW